MQSALRQGQTLDFGGFVMEPGGLLLAEGRSGKAEKRLGWADIQQVTVQGGVVKVAAHGQRRAWAYVSVPHVPNLSAFLTLVRAATSG